MKKWIGIASAFLVGFIVATSGSAFAEQISLIGKKVTGEYTVVVNGKTLSDKGAIIDGKTNVPVRSLSESLGADVKVEGDTIVVTTEETTTNDKVILLDGKYYTKYDLLNEKKRLEDNLAIFKNKLEKENGKAEQMENTTGIVKEMWTSGINTLNDKIKTSNDQLAKINEALKTFE